MSFRNSGIVCPKCGADLAEFSITDYTHGETACGNCGSVLEDHLVDSGAEWRTFEDSTDDPARASKTDPYLAMTTEIAAGGGKGSGGLRSHHYQLLNSDLKQRNLRAAFARFQELTERLDLPAHVIDAAKDIYTKFETTKEKHGISTIKGAKKDAAILAVLWEACRLQRGPSEGGRTLKEFSKETGIDEVSIKKAYKKIMKVLKKAKLPPPPPSSSSSSLPSSTSPPTQRVAAAASPSPSPSPSSLTSSPSTLFPPPLSPASRRSPSSPYPSSSSPPPSNSSLPPITPSVPSLPPQPSSSSSSSASSSASASASASASLPAPPSSQQQQQQQQPSQISRQVEQLIETFGTRLGLPFKFIMTARRLGPQATDLGEGKHPASIAAFCIKFAAEKLDLPPGVKSPSTKELSSVADVSTTTLRNVTKAFSTHHELLERILKSNTK